MANKVYIDDIGLEIIIDMQMDVSDATTYSMKVMKETPLSTPLSSE